MAKKLKVPPNLARRKTGGQAAGPKRRKKKTGGALKRVKTRTGGPTRAERLSGIFGMLPRKTQKRVLRAKKPEKHH
jgi:hypothetical protein